MPTAPASVSRRPQLNPEALALADLEDQRIWTRAWVCVGFEQQIPGIGDLLPATVGNHGLHVQRQPDGSLRAAFNVLQQGSCWTIPVQCGSGHKTDCPYVSCAFSLDTDALSAEAGQPTPAMRQFIGFNALKLAPVALSQFGPLLFLNLDFSGPPTLAEQLGTLPERVGRFGFSQLRNVGRFWLHLDCNWKLAPDTLSNALGGHGGLREGSLTSDELSDLVKVPALSETHRDVWRAGGLDVFPPLAGGEPTVCIHFLFPNLGLAFLRNHAASFVVKPTDVDSCTVVVGLFARPESAQAPGREDAVAALLERWREIAADARARSRQRRAGPASPMLAAAAERLSAGEAPTPA